MKIVLKTLDELGCVRRGKSKHRPRDAAHLYDGPYPFIQTSDVKNADLYITEYTQTYSAAGLAQSKLWKAGTLCITIAANIADTAILSFDSCFPDSIIGFIPDTKKSDARYIKYLFDAVVQQRFKKFTQGAAQDNLSQEKLLSLKLPVAEDVNDQKTIADRLAIYDDLIDINRRRIQLLEEAARLLFREWFVYFRFPGHKKIKIVDGLPEGWERIKFKDIIVTIESGGRPKGGAIDEGIPSIGAENVNGIGKHDYSSEKYVPEEYYQNMKKGKVISKDVLLYKDGANIGRVTIVGYGFPHNKCCVNEHVFILRTKNNIQNWLYFFLSQEFVQQAVANLNSNSAQPGISQEKLSGLKIIFPDEKIVRLFDDTAKDVVRQIFALSIQNKKLAQARDLLLPRLMSGRIDPVR